MRDSSSRRWNRSALEDFSDDAAVMDIVVLEAD